MGPFSPLMAALFIVPLYGLRSVRPTTSEIVSILACLSLVGLSLVSSRLPKRPSVTSRTLLYGFP